MTKVAHTEPLVGSADTVVCKGKLILIKSEDSPCFYRSKVNDINFSFNRLSENWIGIKLIIISETEAPQIGDIIMPTVREILERTKTELQLKNGELYTQIIANDKEIANCEATLKFLDNKDIEESKRTLIKGNSAVEFVITPRNIVEGDKIKWKKLVVKATYGEVNGKSRSIFKMPKTDDGTKNSAKGLLAVYKNENDGGYVLQNEASWESVGSCELKSVFKDGKLYNEQTLSKIRAKLNQEKLVVA